MGVGVGAKWCGRVTGVPVIVNVERDGGRGRVVSALVWKSVVKNGSKDSFRGVVENDEEPDEKIRNRPTILVR